MHKDVRTELFSEDADTTDETQQLIILDGVDADDRPTSDLAADIGTGIDDARAEALEPTKAESEAAIPAIAGSANFIDVQVLLAGD